MDNPSGPERPKRKRRTKKKKATSASTSSDPLGAALGVYSTRRQVILLAVGAAGLILVGILIIGSQESIARWLTDFTMGKDAGALPNTPFALAGWALIVTAIGVIGYAFFMSGKTFEMRERGIRFVRGPRRQEMRWEELVNYSVCEHQLIDLNDMNPRPVTTGFVIDFYTDDDAIHLSKTFLNLVPDVYALLSQISQYVDIEPTRTVVGADGEAAQSDSTGPQRPKKRRRKTPARSKDVDVTKAVAQKLAAGVPPKEVIAWLEEKKGMPTVVAQKVLAQALEE